MKTRILLLLLFVSSFTFAQVPNDEVLHYPFTSGSLVNKANPGIGDLSQSGTAATFVADHYGTSGNAIELNGDQFNAGTTVSSINSELTISFWMKPTSITTSWERIIQIYGGGKGFRLEQKSGNVIGWSGYASSYVGGSSGRSTAITSLYNNAWHHVVVKTYRNTGDNYRVYFDMYIDGVKNANLSGQHLVTTGGNFINNGAFVISPSSVDNYKKSIDDIKVFRRALSDAEITALYNLCENCYTLVTNTVGDGTITTNPASSADNTYSSGTIVTLTANPNTGSSFSEWTGDVSGNSLTTTITVNENKSVTANFKKLPTFVDVYAIGNNDGTSWADAYTDLQTAINNTAVTEEIWVARGVYIPTGNGRSATFNVSKRQKIYGGFAGNETLLSDRDMSLIHTTNGTILSGDLNQNDSAILLENENTRQDNAYHVVTVKGNIASGGILNGFIISGGNANGSLSNSCSTASANQYDHRSGAAIYSNPNDANHKVYLEVNHCKIKDNTALNYAVLGRFSPCGDEGTQSHIDFASSIISNNYSKNTANIGYTGNQQYNIRSYGTIVNSLITGNSNGATDKSSAIIISSGGGSGSYASATVSIINTTIVNNSSANNKAVTINLRSASTFPVYFYNSIIYNNGGTTSINILGSNGASATFANNIIEGGDYSSNSSDPMLNSYYALLTGSPAIDAGDNSKLPASFTTDLFGNPRVFNTTIDIGASEYDPAVLSTEVINDLKNEVTVYPNPTVAVLNIKMDSDLKRATVYSVLGAKVLETSSKKIATSNLKSGLYLIKIEAKNGSVSTKKFMKE